VPHLPQQEAAAKPCRAGDNRSRPVLNLLGVEERLSYSKNKEIAKIVRMYVRDGWQYHKGRKHGKLKAPSGKVIVVPCTPSDRRAALNFVADLRRCHG